MDGIGISVHNYSYWLNKKYGATTLVAPKLKGYKERAEYPVYRFKSVLLPGMNPYRVGLPLVDFQLKKRIAKAGFDLLHAHSPFISGQLARKLATAHKVPLVATVHGNYKEDFQRVIDNELFADFLLGYTLDFYTKADYVWVPDKATGEILRNSGYNKEVEVIPNGTDMEIPDKSKLIRLRKKGLDMVGEPPDKFIILFVGELRWEKNLKLIMDALKIADAAGKVFTMVFVGEGYASGELKRLARKLKLTSKVHFTGLITDRKALRSIYAAADLFVFPSVQDTFPVVIREAAAFSVPSMVISGSASSGGIVDGISGFIAENQAESVARKIMELMDNPEALKLAGEGARKSIYRSWESVIDLVYMRYSEIILEWRSSSRNKETE
jgi:glycosyltransferase involved in cell wall biosynthesis